MNDTTSSKPFLPTGSVGKGEFHLDPTAFHLTKLDLYPHAVTLKEKEGDKTFLDLRPQLDMILITESIFQSALHVNIGITDAVGLLDTLRIQGGEKIRLRIEQNIKKSVFHDTLNTEFVKDIDLELYISDIKNFEKPKIDTQTYTLECVTKPAYLNQLKVLNEKFEGTPAELIKRIVKRELELDEEDLVVPRLRGLLPEIEAYAPNSKTLDQSLAGGAAATGDDGYGEPIKGIYPKLRPFAAIHWLLRNTNDNGTPVFFFEGMTRGYQLKSWEDFLGMDNKPYFLPYSNSPLEDNFEPGTKMDIDHEDWYDANRRKVITLQSSLGLSKYNDARKGAYASNLTTVDFSTKIYKSGKEGSVFKYDDKMVKLNRFKPFSDKIKFNGGALNEDVNKNSRNFFVSENLWAFKKWNNYHSALTPDAIQKKESYKANIDMLTHTMTIPGDPILGAGVVVDLKVWKIQDQNLDPGDTASIYGDELMGGRFVIKKIHHLFKPTGYTMEVEIIKDSSRVDLDEEIQV
jgi:hypothetical protein